MSSKINKLVMEAVADFEFRNKFLSDPIATARAKGADDETIEELKKVDMRRLRYQFDNLSTACLQNRF